jgi:hypothetical protein
VGRADIDIKAGLLTAEKPPEKDILEILGVRNG